MALLTKLVLVAGLSVASAAGIYPDDHFDYSTRLTTANFNDEIKSAVDGGKTMFAPEWNKVVKDFAQEESVVFGDVLLRNDRITQGPNGGNLSPGKGGWPTIRYFNKGTGYDGAEYQKKTSDSMCSELGPNKPYLTQYIQEYGVAAAAKEL